MKTIFLVTEGIAKSSMPFSKGEFLKSCIMKVCDVLCPDKRQTFGNLRMSKNTIADRGCKMATDLRA